MGGRHGTGEAAGRSSGPCAPKSHGPFGYDRNSNRLWRKNWQTSGKDEYYGYDGLNRLVKFNRGELVGDPPSIADANAVLNQAWPELEALGNWREFKWDPNGGADLWTVQDRTHNKANETVTVSGSGANWPDPNYDAAGNMIDGPQAITCDTQIHFVYDAWNRLVAASCESWSYSYRYDGLGRRIRKISEEWPLDYYHNNSWQVLEIRKDQDPNAYEQYVWGANYIDAAVIRWHDGNLDGDLNDQGDNTLYYTYDANFNVTALVEPDGDVGERYVYEPYGLVTVLGEAWDWRANSVFGNEILYCGYRRDGETGLYHVRNRYYHPRLGRWMSTDRIVYLDSMNLYEYSESKPLLTTDPSGLWPCCKDECSAGDIRNITADEVRFRWSRAKHSPGAVEDCEKAVKWCQRIGALKDVGSVASACPNFAKMLLNACDVAIHRRRNCGMVDEMIAAIKSLEGPLMETYGVGIWVHVTWQKCEWRRCWSALWMKGHNTWVENQKWHRCIAAGKDDPTWCGFQVTDRVGIASAIPGCLQEAMGSVE